MPDGLDLDALKALSEAATDGPWEVDKPFFVRASADRDVAFTTSDEDAAFIAHARTAVPALIAEVKRLRGELDREHQRAEGWADQYNRVARQIADLRDERDTAIAEAKQARKDAQESWADAWAEVQRLDALLQTVTAERDRRGDELRRTQAVIDAAKAWRGWMRLVDKLTPAGLSGPSRDLAAAVDALEAPVPP